MDDTATARLSESRKARFIEFESDADDERDEPIRKVRPAELKAQLEYMKQKLIAAKGKEERILAATAPLSPSTTEEEVSPYASTRDLANAGDIPEDIYFFDDWRKPSNKFSPHGNQNHALAHHKAEFGLHQPRSQESSHEEEEQHTLVRVMSEEDAFFFGKPDTSHTIV